MNSPDRLVVAIFLATLIHAIMIFGVRFRFPHAHASHVMEVTLATHRSLRPNPKADFLAQATQEGSGQLKEARVIQSPEQSPFHDAKIQETTPMQQQHEQTEDQEQRVTTRGASRKVSDLLARRQTQEVAGIKDQNSETQTQEIASLEARLAAHRQAYARMPRVSTVSSVSTRYDLDAAYIDAFRRKIELVGNEYYPAQARLLHLSGSVRLMVTLDVDGRVVQIETLKRSGSAILDAAAERSVWAAQPFQPFPAALRKKSDILRIIRTWKYDDRLISTTE